jgi:hypothetical protein
VLINTQPLLAGTQAIQLRSNLGNLEISLSKLSGISSDAAPDITGPNSGVVARLREDHDQVVTQSCDLHLLQRDFERCVYAGMGVHKNGSPHIVQLAYLAANAVNFDWNNYTRFLGELSNTSKIDRVVYDELISSRLQESVFTRWWTVGAAIVYCNNHRSFISL